MSIRPGGGASVAPGTSLPVPVDPDDDDKVVTAQGGEYVLAAPPDGGGSIGAPCWFSGTYYAQVAASGAMSHPSWDSITDGVAAGTDVIINEDDATKLEVVTPGTYLVTMSAGFVNGSDAHLAEGYVTLNDDAAGPAYYIGERVPIDSYVNIPPFPLELVAGDLLSISLHLLGATTPGTANGCTAVLLRLG